jgi:hypothetical protein
MEELLSLFIVVAVILTAIGVMAYPLGGHPFWWAKWLRKGSARMFRAISRQLYRWARDIRRTRGRWYVRPALLLLSLPLGIGGFLTSIPAEILGEGTKKK